MKLVLENPYCIDLVSENVQDAIFLKNFCSTYSNMSEHVKVVYPGKNSVTTYRTADAVDGITMLRFMAEVP